MRVTLEQLYLGKSTRIKEKEYFTTEQYVMPFIDRMSKFTDKFEIQVKPADQISLTNDGEVNLENKKLCNKLKETDLFLNLTSK